MKKTELIALSALLGLFVAVGGCAMTQVSADSDPRANFATYRTFQVQGGQVINQGQPDPNDTLIRDRVVAALYSELQEKGLRPAQQDPDLIVKYTTQTYTHPELRYDPGWDAFGAWGPYWGRGPYWGYAYSPYSFGGWDTWVDEVKTGLVTVDVIDADSGRLVFRAEAQSDDTNFRRPDHIRKVVDKALRQYPQLRFGPAS
jgi:hypothetical protein